MSALTWTAPLATSPEAAAGAAVYRATRSAADAVRDCSSGRELRAAGFGDDVEIAVTEAGVPVVPVMRRGGFVAATD